MKRADVSQTSTVDLGGGPRSGGWIASFGEAGLSLPVQSDEPVLSFASTSSCAVIFDGILYDPEVLGTRREKTSRSISNDANVILDAYLRWGEDVVHKIKGMFSLVIWDRRSDTLLCVRDPLGAYPLFYADAGRELLLSTSIEALVRHPRVSQAVDRVVLAELISERWVSLEETAYASVKRIPPGHAMRVTRSSRRVFRYWDPAPEGSEFEWVREDGLEQFDELLDKAVARCLDLGQSGICLSGGLDSASVAMVAADIARRKPLPAPWALSIVNPHPESDQSAIQIGVAKELGLPQFLVSFDEAAGSKGLLHSALEMSRHWPVPLVNCCLPTLRSLCREGKRRGCKVILTGDGGDEWLTVNPILAVDLIRALDGKGLYHLWNSLHSSYSISRLQCLGRLLWGWGLRLLIVGAAQRVLLNLAPNALSIVQRRRISNSIPDWVANDPTLRKEMVRRAEERRQKHLSGSHYAGRMRLALDHPLVAIGKEELFEVGRRMGVRFLHPFWDPDLVSFLYRTPPECLNRGGRSKGLVRDKLHRRFPDLGFERQQKVVPEAFFQSFMAREAALAWQAMGGTPALVELGIVAEQPLNAALKTVFTSARLQDIYPIWTVLNVEMWLRGRRETLNTEEATRYV